MHPYGHIQEKSNIRCSSFGRNSILVYLSQSLLSKLLVLMEHKDNSKYDFKFSGSFYHFLR